MIPGGANRVLCELLRGHDDRFTMDLIDGVRVMFEAEVNKDTAAAPALKRVLALLPELRLNPERAEATQLPVCRHLSRALDIGEAGPAAAVATAFRELAPTLSWAQSTRHNVENKAERRMTELEGGVESVAERQESVTVLSQRVDRIMSDIEQGRQALTQATEHFDRVAELRKEAAGAVQTLEDQIRAASEDLRNAEEQSEKVGLRAERLEARAGSLRFAEKRITQFEEKLAQLDKVEQELDRSIETLMARQDSLDQVRDDVQMLFATSENTLEDVKAISAARDEVQGAREMLDLVRSKADTMEQALGSIDERQRQSPGAPPRATPFSSSRRDSMRPPQVHGSFSPQTPESKSRA